MPAIVQEELWKQPGHPGMIIVTTNAAKSNLICNKETCMIEMADAGALP
jgi:hypothetical protein